VLVEAPNAIAAEHAVLGKRARDSGRVTLVGLGALAIGLGVDAASLEEWGAVGRVGAALVEVDVVGLAFPAPAEVPPGVHLTETG